jgi:macrodomain Ter protein organizer (MatP/YcbG family)
MNPTNKLQFRVHKEDDGTTVKWHYILQQWWDGRGIMRYPDGSYGVESGEWRDVPIAPYVPVVIS